MMKEVFLVGVAMTPFGIHMEKCVGDLARMAVTASLEDAGLTSQSIEAAFFANTAQGSMEGQHAVRGQHALRPIGFDGCPIYNIEDACAGSAVALNLAYTQVASGRCNVAMAVGAEKLHTDDRTKRLAVFGQPLDLAAVTEFVNNYSSSVSDIQPPPDTFIDESMRSIFMDTYAVLAKMHMKKYGTTWEQIAQVSVKNHRHSTLNPLAQFQKEIPFEKVIGGRVVSWPLTVPMCAPVSDGASAAILCSREVLTRSASKRHVRMMASQVMGGGRRDLADPRSAALYKAATRAYSEAHIGPHDISVAEVHDASAYAEIAQIEMIGLCEFGQGGKVTETGETALGGRIPVNPSGGLQSKGHPIAATGIGQVFELATQLRGEAGARQVPGAKHAIASCGGGFMGVEEAIAAVHILGTA
jgi:acetyl-CoA acyltransferase